MPENEVWKAIPGYEGLYEVSDHGRVRSLQRKIIRITGVEHTVPGRIMRQNPTGGRSRRYLAVGLSKTGNVEQIYVHRLVTAVFLGECPDGLEVNHKDGDHKNNHADNLEYVTRGENVRHARDVLGTLKYTPRDMPKGEDAANAKLTWDQVRQIRKLYKSGQHSQSKLAAMFNIGQAQIWRIVHNKRWVEEK